MADAAESTNDAVLDARGLEQNRAGRLTTDQSRLWLSLRSGLAFGMYFWAVWVVATSWAVLSLTSSTGWTAGSGLAVSAAVGALLALGTKRWLDVGYDVRAGRVAQASGTIRKSRIPLRSERQSLLAFIWAGNERFQCDSIAWLSLPASGAGRIYYLPRSRRVVNFEPLPARDIREH